MPDQATAVSVIDQCQDLWNKVVKSGPAKRSQESNREKDANYISGHSDDHTDWDFSLNGYSVSARETDWQRFSPSSDRSGTRRMLSITREKELVFKATQEGGSSVERFGAGERYQGRTSKPAEPWKIEKGNIPEELL